MCRSPANPTVVGAAPEGASDPQSAARAVREMFTSIAPRYDLLNHVLVVQHRPHVVAPDRPTFPAHLGRADARVLDLCCGTGDMTFALRRQGREVVSADSGCRFLARHAAAGDCEIVGGGERIGAGMDRSRCAQPSVSERALRSGDFGISVSAISPTTTPDCARSFACCDPAENAASSISASLRE